MPVYVVDEPFLGLDPLDSYLTSSLEREEEKGAAILMSTHVLDTAEKYCDRFHRIHEGESNCIRRYRRLTRNFGY